MCKALRAEGWQAVRSAGSHGLWDVTAVGPAETRLIQVWYTKTKGFVKDENAELFRKLHVGVGTTKQLWIYRFGNATPEVHPC